MLKIAETFTSVQGEGDWIGVPMFFVRLAGCNVGKKDIASDPSLPWETCTTIEGNHFTCDTNFRKQEEWSVDDLVKAFKESGLDHICITGGEPFLQAEVIDLIKHFGRVGEGTCHVETSGTLPIPEGLPCWITCSPKQGFLKSNIKEVEEFKFLVGRDTDIPKLEEVIESLDIERSAIFLSPINFVADLDTSSLNACLQLLVKHPSWRLGVQLHKVYNLR